jgi:hypothetical protein
MKATQKKIAEDVKEPEKVAIPAAKRAAIVKNLRKLGLPPTEQLIEKMYSEDAEFRSQGFKTKKEEKK